MKRVLIGLLALVLGSFLLLGSVLGWIAWRGSSISAHARELCARFPAGSDPAQFAASAQELDLRTIPGIPVSDHPLGQVTVHTAYGAVLLARWSCSVEVHQGKVVAASVSFVD